MAYVALCLTIVAILIAGGVGLWYINEINPGVTEDAEPKAFTIRRRDTMETISERLAAEGIIENPGLFRWYVDHHGGLELTPGYYEMRPGDHMGNIVGRFRTPPSQTYSEVTFPEGFTVAQIAAPPGQDDAPRMTVRGFHEAVLGDERIAPLLRPPGQASLEGLLFPDTYEVSNSENETQVILRMLALMERVASQEGIDEGATRLGRTPYEVLTVASMIEREAKVAEDRPKIARVIYNRLARGMPLQIDATLYYQQDPNAVRRVARHRHAVQHLLHTGLPPTPIANPGRDSIRAALNPAPDPATGDPSVCELREVAASSGHTPEPCIYLFYVLADEDGRHAFAATEWQHQANIDRQLPPGCCEGCRPHRLSGRPQPLTCHSQRRVRRRWSRVDTTSPSTSRPAGGRTRPSGDAHARHRWPVRHDAAQRRGRRRR